MIIFVPGRRYTIYFCPRCKKRQHFFSWIPILNPEWTCRRCGQTCQINASRVGTNWCYGFALWSMPVTFVLAVPVLFIGLLIDSMHKPVPLPLLLERLIGGPLVIGLIFAVGAVVPGLLLGFFAGLIYGAIAISRRRSESERPRPRRKKRRHDDDLAAPA